MQTDFLLFQIDCERGQAANVAFAFENFCATSELGLVAHRTAYVLDKPQMYAYASLPSQMQIGLEACQALEASFHKASGHMPRISRLQLKLKPAAVSQKSTPLFHYVVETDVDDGWWDEIARWYDEEHMPGLAKVTGCVSAMRLVNLDAKCEEGDNRPRSFACYDLQSPAVLESPAWLAVRHTTWSDIARPHFCNTKRSMMEIIYGKS